MQIFFAPVVDGHLQGTMLSMCIYHISYPFAAMRCSMVGEEPARIASYRGLVDQCNNTHTGRNGMTLAS